MEDSKKPIEEETKEELPQELPLLQAETSIKIPKGTFEVLNPGLFEDKYYLDRFLGKGAFGSVNACILKDNREVVRAVKLVSKVASAKHKDSFFHEMEMLKRASHPNVLKVFELFEDVTHYYIVTELFEG
jgi:Protein kinase domain